MADPTSSAIQALKSPPLRHDPAAMARSSLDISPNRSSVQSSGVHTPSSSVPSTPVTSVRGISPEEKPLHYGNSNTFLTELAAHERRVLELKEELQKAEEELDRLKKQWASHEAAKRRNEVRHLEQLQPLKASLSGSEISRDTGLDPSTRELDRRKMLPPPIKPLQRTVFSGSRHARTLSLLSPKDFVQGSTSPSRGYGQLRHNRNTIDDTVKSTTTHELGTSTDGPNDPHTRHKDLPKDVILETGKQLVGDFRQGLWTFFEDLKQVTVGDEAASASDPRYQHCLPAGSLPKTQARRERWTTVKKNPTREGKSLSGDISARRQNTEPSPSPGRIHMRSVEQVRAPSKPPSILGGYYSPRNMNTNSSESDDNDGCTYRLSQSSLMQISTESFMNYQIAFLL